MNRGCSLPGRTIYEKLASARQKSRLCCTTSGWREISPNIRHCAYNIGERGCAGQRQAAQVD